MLGSWLCSSWHVSWGALYFINNINEDDLVTLPPGTWGNTALFLVFFLPGAMSSARCFADSYVIRQAGEVSSRQHHKYRELPADASSATACIPWLWCGGCAQGHYPHARCGNRHSTREGIGFCRLRGRSLTVGQLLLVASHNNNTGLLSVYHDLQNSLTLANSCSRASSH